MLCALLIVAGSPARGAELAVPAQGTADEAVALARSGRLDEALRLLAELRAADPDDVRLIHDQTVVLGWAERDAAVLANAQRLDPAETPGYVALAVAKSARNLGRYDVAETWYRRAVGQNPGDVDARLGLAMTRADRGDTGAARETLAALPSGAADGVQALLARAYVEQRAGHPLAALGQYEAVLARQPGHDSALRGKALMLRALLLPSEALELAARHPSILSDAEVARLRADEAALKVRLTAATSYPPELRDAAHRRTLASIDRALAQLGDAAARAALEADRVVALVDAGRPQEAVGQLERLRRNGQPVPRHALAAAAAAHLRLEQPERAVELLEAAAAAAPDDASLQFDLVFAYLDAERHDDALRVARSLAERFPLIPGEADDIAA
ncbi:MAG: tetratricopeptide repeat protein, partial [Gammaproteobacteria bacterium]|nr:tetratricopeptide repeat protein [Gammaproteobacteria bacterium]